MIDEIRKIKLQPILEKLQQENKIKETIEANNRAIKIECEKDPMSSKTHELKTKNYHLKEQLEELKEVKREKNNIENASIYDLGMDFEEAIKFLKERNIDIVLAEADKKAIYNPENQKKDIESLKDLILVHKTDYPPKDSKLRSSKESKATRKSEITISGKEYAFEYADPRNTIHFYDNGEVGTNDGGSWNECKYIIMIPFDSVDKNKIIGGSEVDTYCKESIDLTKDTVVLCPKGKKNSIARDNPNINVIEYEGEVALGYGDAMVSALGYYEEGQHGYYWYNREKKDRVAELYKTNGLKLARHKGSEEELDESKQAKINRKVAYCKFLIEHLKEISSKKDLYGVETTPWDFAKEELNDLFEQLEINGINIPDMKKEIILRSFDEEPMMVLDEFQRTNPELIKEMKLDIQEHNLLKRNLKIEKANQMLDYVLLSEVGKERLLEIEKEKEKSILSKKMKDFYVSPSTLERNNATDIESEICEKIKQEKLELINKKLLEKGINKYYFDIGYEKLSLNTKSLTWQDTVNNINLDLSEKEHYIGDDVVSGLPTLDFQEKEDETVSEYLDRLTNYTENFSKYYDGKTVDESIKFDENGDLIEEPTVSKEDFGKVAISKEAIIELESGRTVKEIREEMSPNKEKEGEEVGIDG